MARIQPFREIRLDDRELVFRRAVLQLDPDSRVWEVVLYGPLPLAAQVDTTREEHELTGLLTNGVRFAGRVAVDPASSQVVRLVGLDRGVLRRAGRAA